MKRQRKKTAPRGWLRGSWSKQALRILKERYLWKDERGEVIETPEGMFYRVAKEAVGAEKKYRVPSQKRKQLLCQFYEMMVRRDFLPNSPTLMNAGKGNRLQYSACFVLPVGDSMEGIFEAAKRGAIIHKSGGGTGFSFSRLRPKGSVVGTSKGVASGPVSFMKVFDAATEQVKQGGMRRGANMGILRVDHPDILEFVTCKIDGGVSNFNISVAATDEFMEALARGKDFYFRAQPGWPKPKGGKFKGGERLGKVSAKKIFDQIVEAAWKSGDPGMVFIDRINNSPSNPVPSMGPIEATNPCLVASTLISTDRGLLPLGEIVEKRLGVKVLVDQRGGGKEGFAYRDLIGFYNRGKKRIWRLRTKRGFEIEGTADHLVLTPRGWVALAKLRPGQDEVFLQGQEGRFGEKRRLPFEFENEQVGRNGQQYQFNLPKDWSEELGLVLGWLVGDGWLREDKKEARVGFSFGEEDQGAMKKIEEIMNGWYGKRIAPVKRENGVWHLSYHSKFLVEFFEKLGVESVSAERKRVPEALWTAPREAVVGFLRGLFTADGAVGYQKEKKSKYIRLTSKSLSFLREVQLLLLNLGILSQIYDRSRPSRTRFSTTNKEGKKKEYLSDGVCFELNISRESMEKFVEEVGFLGGRHRQKITEALRASSYRQEFVDQVVEVEETGREEVVYDIKVEKDSLFFANGILVHNCGEQPLYPNEACNLGSINLANMVGRKGVDWEKLKRTVKLAIRFLDDIVDVSPFPFEEITQAVLNNRRVGLGVMGWADLLFELKIPYDSSEAMRLAKRVMKFINRWAWKTSEELAEERGPFPNFSRSIYKDGKPRRNATVTTIAPTGSISIIANCSSGIEPVFALAFTHQANGRVLHFVNPIFEREVLKYKEGRRIYEEVKRLGNLSEVEGVPQKLREIFKTAHEIHWRWHIKTQAAFQKYTDNAVSKTINLPNSARVEDVAAAYLYAYRVGCKGITVFRDGCKEEQVLSLGTEKEKKEKVEGFVVKERPAVVKGFTYRIETPVGTAFVTINHNGQTDQPLELFVNVGKAGSDVAADAEAIGRLISLCLRISSPGLSPRKVAELIVDQLEGIGGGGSIGFGKERVRSLADGIAKVIKKHLINGSREEKEEGDVSLVGQQTAMPHFEFKGSEFKEKKGASRDICPKCGNASLIYEEGCARCLSCGFSKC